MSARQVIRRLLLAIPTALTASLVLFALMWVGPDPLASIAQEAGMSAADVARLRSASGLDGSFWHQYLHWLSGLARGNLGTSIRTNGPAAGMIVDTLWVSMALVVSSLAISLAIAVPLGALAARRAHSRVDITVTAGATVLMAVPAFLVALLLQLGAVWLKDLTGRPLLHVSGGLHGISPGEVAGHLALPVATLVAVQVAGWVRYSRGQVLESLGQEFVTAAHAKGLPSRTVMVRHTLRAAAAPLITLAALDLGTIIGGAVIVESVFGLPGTGRLLLDAMQAHDTVVALDIVTLAAVFVTVVTAGADLLNGWLDPRTRVGD